MAAEPMTDDQVNFLMVVANATRRIEREACAKLAESMGGIETAQAIRERKNGD
jgi:hypothetical protein